MDCPDCRLFFLELHRRCTINLNGECDCPICQGVCNCKVAAREAMPRLTTADTIHYTADEVQTITTRRFGEKRNP